MSDIFCLYTEFDNILFSHRMHIDIPPFAIKENGLSHNHKTEKLLAMIPAFRD